MEKIREKEAIYYGSESSYFTLQKSTEVELNTDIIFSITKYLGKICGVLSKDIRKRWLVTIGVTMDLNYLWETKYLYLIKMQKCVKSINLKTVAFLEAFNFDDFPLLDTIIINETILTNGSHIIKLLKKFLLRMIKSGKINNIILDWSRSYDFILRGKMHKYVVNYLFVRAIENEIILAFDKEILEKMRIINYTNGIEISPADMITLKNLTHSDKFIKDNCGVLTCEDLIDVFSCFNFLKRIKKYDFKDLVLHAILIGSERNILYANQIIVPIYKDLGISIKLIIVGNKLDILEGDKNSYIGDLRHYSRNTKVTDDDARKKIEEYLNSRL